MPEVLQNFITPIAKLDGLDYCISISGVLKYMLLVQVGIQRVKRKTLDFRLPKKTFHSINVQ